MYLFQENITTTIITTIGIDPSVEASKEDGSGQWIFYAIIVAAIFLLLAIIIFSVCLYLYCRTTPDTPMTSEIYRQRMLDAGSSAVEFDRHGPGGSSKSSNTDSDPVFKPNRLKVKKKKSIRSTESRDGEYMGTDEDDTEIKPQKRKMIAMEDEPPNRNKRRAVRSISGYNTNRLVDEEEEEKTKQRLDRVEYDSHDDLNQEPAEEKPIKRKRVSLSDKPRTTSITKKKGSSSRKKTARPDPSEPKEPPRRVLSRSTVLDEPVNEEENNGPSRKSSKPPRIELVDGVVVFNTAVSEVKVEDVSRDDEIIEPYNTEVMPKSEEIVVTYQAIDSSEGPLPTKYANVRVPSTENLSVVKNKKAAGK